MYYIGSVLGIESFNELCENRGWYYQSFPNVLLFDSYSIYDIKYIHILLLITLILQEIIDYKLQVLFSIIKQVPLYLRLLILFPKPYIIINYHRYIFISMCWEQGLFIVLHCLPQPKFQQQKQIGVYLVCHRLMLDGVYYFR